MFNQGIEWYWGPTEPPDEDLVHETRENWHKNKLKIEKK